MYIPSAYIFCIFQEDQYSSKVLAEAHVSVSYDSVLLFCLIKDSTYENGVVCLNFHVELIGNKMR